MISRFSSDPSYAGPLGPPGRTRLDVTDLDLDLARNLGVTVGCLAGAGIAKGRLVTASWRSRAVDRRIEP